MLLPRDILIEKLDANGYQDIARAVIKGDSNSLTAEKKKILMEYGNQVRRTFELNSKMLEQSLIEVTTSGWGNEPESTTPGAIQPIMALSSKPE